MKWIIALIVLVLAAGGGAWWYWQYRAAGQDQDAAPQWVKVERSDLRTSVPSTGKVVSNLDVDIKCKASGEIIKLPFDVSDDVKKGDLLVELDPVDEQREVSLAKAALQAAQARLASAKQNLEIATKTLEIDRMRADAAVASAKAQDQDKSNRAGRMADLLQKKLASQEDYDTAQTAAVEAQAQLQNALAQAQELKTKEMALELRRQEVKLAQSEVESDEIALSNSQQRLADTKVVAPMDAVVSGRTVQIGQIISSGITNVGGGTTILTLSDLSQVYVSASVDESDIGKVQVGQEVEVTADAYPSVHFAGQVVRIATRGVNVSNVVTFEVKIEVLSKNKRLLKPEMTANVEVITAQKQAILTVPTEAVTRQKGQAVVTVVGPAGEKVERQVELGISDGARREVIQGLEEGESVLIQPGQAESRWRAQGNNGAGATGQRRMMMRVGGGHP